MSNRAGNLVRNLNIGGAEVHVVGDQRRPRSYSRYSSRWVNPRLSKVGPARFAGSDFVSYAFELTLAYAGQILTLGSGRGLLVKVNGYSQFAPQPFTTGARKRHAIVHRSSRDGHEWN